jgi:hyperosmotically inducible periplasmic protein
MRTNQPRRRTLKRSLLTMGMLALIVVAAMVTFSKAQQHPTAPTTPAPLTPVQVQTAPGTSPSFGQQVGDAVDSLKKGVNDAAQTVEAEYGKARDAIQSMGVQARVYSRLHWDKDLADASLTIESPSPGVVTLSGNLANAAAKTKAVRLAEDTVGVTKVLDQLTLATPTATAPTTTTPTAATATSAAPTAP